MVRGARRVKPTFELLEGRDCPAAPVINFLSATHEPGGQVLLSGTVTDETPESVLIQFSGGAEGYTYADAQGNFAATLDMTSTDPVYATASDDEVSFSDTLDVVPANNAPQIVNFSVTIEDGPGNFFTFSGQVSDEELSAGQYVILGGIPSLEGQAVAIDESGYFSWTIQLQPGEEGTATADFADVWGEAAETQYAIVRQANS
jgi:hypothetical protein